MDIIIELESSGRIKGKPMASEQRHPVAEQPGEAPDKHSWFEGDAHSSPKAWRPSATPFCPLGNPRMSQETSQWRSGYPRSPIHLQNTEGFGPSRSRCESSDIPSVRSDHNKDTQNPALRPLPFSFTTNQVLALAQIPAGLRTRP